MLAALCATRRASRLARLSKIIALEILATERFHQNLPWMASDRDKIHITVIHLRAYYKRYGEVESSTDQDSSWCKLISRKWSGPMANRSLDIYLNDHLAGSVVAIQLLEYLASAYAGSQVENAITGLLNDVRADRHELEELMKLLGSGQSPVRKASAWMSEKLAQVKLLFDDPKGGSFRLFEGMEALSLGILGKRSLWQTLSTLAESSAKLPVCDYPRLIQRAEEQYARAEEIRMAAAKASLVMNGS